MKMCISFLKLLLWGNYLTFLTYFGGKLDANLSLYPILLVFL